MATKKETHIEQTGADVVQTPHKWLTTTEAAKLLGYKDGSVFRHAIKRGDLVEGKHVVMLGNRWFILRDAAIQYHKDMLADFAARRPPYQGPDSSSIPQD